MTWLTENLYSISIVGGILFILSFLRVSCIQPVWKLFWPGVGLLALAAAGALFVAFGTPGSEETQIEQVVPKPHAELALHIDRLQTPWDSELRADWPVAETLASISETAYLPPVDADPELRLLGFEQITPIVAGSMIGYVMSARDVAVIAFRGTDAADVSDWLANLDRASVATNHGHVQRGFNNAYFSLQPQILTILKRRQPKHLWITGHSLGGAIALVCAYNLMDVEGMQIDGLMTFGQPMVARSDLASYLDELLIGKYAHFVNNSDIVPRVPPSYKACGSMVWFTGDGLRRSKSHRQVFGAGGNLPVGDAPSDSTDPETADLPAMSEAEFEQLQQNMKKDSSVLMQSSGSPEVVAAAAMPLIDDHSMVIYVQKVRLLIGSSTTSIPE